MTQSLQRPAIPVPSRHNREQTHPGPVQTWSQPRDKARNKVSQSHGILLWTVHSDGLTVASPLEETRSKGESSANSVGIAFQCRHGSHSASLSTLRISSTTTLLPSSDRCSPSLRTHVEKKTCVLLSPGQEVGTKSKQMDSREACSHPVLPLLHGMPEIHHLELHLLAQSHAGVGVQAAGLVGPDDLAQYGYATAAHTTQHVFTICICMRTMIQIHLSQSHSHPPG
jgi:hypothetical protein